MKPHATLPSASNPMDTAGSGFPVRHTRDSPVHIIGHGRSGTSILAALMRRYLGVAFGTESQFIVRYYRRLAAYGDLERDDNCRRLIEDLVAERYFQRSRKFGFQVDAQAIFEATVSRSYAGVLAATFGQLASQLGMSRWGDKSPEYIHHLAVLRELFPNAQFIHMVRDGRDVALSSIREPVFGTKNVHKAAREWRRHLELAREFAATLPVDQFYEVRYEDLLTQPVEVFAKLMDYLGIDDREGKLLGFLVEHLPRDVKSGNFGKWRRELSQRQQGRFDALAADLLRSYGYEAACERARRPGPWENLYWDLDDQLRKWMRPEHWRDNVYRARLRLVDWWKKRS